MEKFNVYGILGVVGSIIAQYLGGFDAAVVTLLCFMAVDYITGLIVAGVFKRSGKSSDGALSSSAGWKGLLKKVVVLLIVGATAQFESYCGTHFLRDAVVIAYMANEGISIIENCGLMGVPIPDKLKNAITALQEKPKTEDKKNE